MPSLASGAVRLLYAAVAVILLATAYFVGYSNGSSGGPIGLSLGGQNDYQRGYDDAHEKIIAAGLVREAIPIATLVGTVSAIDGDTLTISVPQAVRDPLAEPAPVERRVTVGSDTLLIKRTLTDPDAYQKEIAAYTERIEKGLAVGEPPSPFEEGDLQRAEIAVGDRLEVHGADGADLTYAKDIAAPERVIKLIGAFASAPQQEIPPLDIPLVNPADLEIRVEAPPPAPEVPPPADVPLERP